MLKACGSLVAQPMLSREHGQHNPTVWRDWGYHSFRARVPEKGNAFSSRGLFVVCVRGCGSKIAGLCGDAGLLRGTRARAGQKRRERI